MGLFDKTPKYDIDLDKFEVSEPNHAEVFNKRVEKLVQSLEWMKENVFTKDRVLKSTDIQEDGYAMDGRILTEHLKNIVASFEKKLSEGLRKKVDSIEGKGLSANDFTDLLKDKLDGIAENANKYIHPKHKKYDTGLYKVTVDEEGHVISAEPITKEDITELGIPGQDTDTTYGLVSTEAAGLAPRRTGTTTKYLCDDGTWRTPPDTDTTYDLVSTEAAGLAPKRTGTETKYLCDDGTWKTPPDTDTTYGVVSKNAPGLVPKCTGTETKYLCDDGTWKVPPDTDTTYETGNTKTAGIGKLYTETGDSTDGSMTQKAISEGFAELNRNIEVLNEWNVIKFANGLVIATLERNLGSIALTLSTGNIYTNISHSGVSIPLPNDIFKKILSSSMNVQTDGYTLCQISSVSISYVTYRIWSPYSTTLSQCIASWMVVGMWK